MANKNKKVIRLQQQKAKGMMDQAVKDIMDVSEEVANQLELKRGMLQTILDTVEDEFRQNGVKVPLRLAEEGYHFLFSDIHDYIDSDDGDDVSEWPDYLDEGEMDEEGDPIEMFSGTDEEGNQYEILVFLNAADDDEDAFNMSITVARHITDPEHRLQVLKEDGWETLDIDPEDVLNFITEDDDTDDEDLF